MKKIVIITFCFMGVLLAFYLGKCIGSWPNSKETISAVEKDSGLKIPSDGKVVFTISDNVFMHGRLGQYTAISFNDKPEEFLSSNNFSSELPSDFQKQFLEGFESCYTINVKNIFRKQTKKPKFYFSLFLTIILYPLIYFLPQFQMK